MVTEMVEILMETEILADSTGMEMGEPVMETKKLILLSIVGGKLQIIKAKELLNQRAEKIMLVGTQKTEVVLVLVVQVMITPKKSMVTKQLKQLMSGCLSRRQHPLAILGGQDASTHY
mgnify:CR=1 FL=1